MGGGREAERLPDPTGAGPGAVGAYVRSLVELLGERDPLEVLEVGPARVRGALTAFPADRLRTPEAPGRWRAVEVVAHLADSELVWGWRLRQVLAADRPRLSGYDQDAWAARLGYRDADPEEALLLFDLLRKANLRLLGSAGEGALDRVGVHAERGEETLAHQLRLYAGHDLVHLRQIERIRATVA